jgi:hypothetical protein
MSVNVPTDNLAMGDHTVEFYAVDNIANRGTVRLLRFAKISLDSVAIEFGNPVAVSNGVTFISSQTPVTVSTPYTSLKVQYQIVEGSNAPVDGNWVSSNNNSITFTVPNTLSDGPYTIYYRAFSGNKFGSTKSIQVRLDNTPPSVNINISDGAIMMDGDVITITATDDGSGVARIFYRIDGGDWVSA